MVRFSADRNQSRNRVIARVMKSYYTLLNTQDFFPPTRGSVHTHTHTHTHNTPPTQHNGAPTILKSWRTVGLESGIRQI